MNFSLNLVYKKNTIKMQYIKLCYLMVQYTVPRSLSRVVVSNMNSYSVGLHTSYCISVYNNIDDNKYFF